jgi:oxygen-dependent protoporphyrinogen oxidase
MSRTDRWIIVGGGASGLASAFFLKQLGLDSVIVERDRTLGGRMGGMQLGARTLDGGGKNIGRRYELFRQFVASLGSHPFEYFGLNSSQVIDGEVRTFDARSRWRTLIHLMRGISPADVIRFGRLLWRVRADESAGYLGSASSRTLAARYDRYPVNRYFSREFCRRVLRPMSVRMNGAEPDEIYMGNLGSNLRMILDTYEQLEEGLAPLFHQFQARYDVRLETEVQELLVTDGRVDGVIVTQPGGATEELRGAGVILATPAHTAAALVAPIAPNLAEHLRVIAYHPVALVIAEYDRPVFASQTRAFVFDEDDVVSNAGAYGINDLHIVRYTFSGRVARACMGRAADPERMLAAGEQALGRHVPLDPAWRRRFVARHYDPGLCAYAAHHARWLDRLDTALTATTGLYLTGDYLQGASIEACFRAASTCVRRLAREREPAARAAAAAARVPDAPLVIQVTPDHAREIRDEQLLSR